MRVRVLKKAQEVLESNAISVEEWCLLFQELYNLQNDVSPPQCAVEDTGDHWPPEALIGFQIWRPSKHELVVMKIVRAVSA